MRLFNRVVGFGCAVAILLGTHVLGQAPPASAATKARDYSQGFRAFLRMGLPDTSKATYVQLDRQRPGMFGPKDYSLREVQLRGNAWLLEEDKSATSTLLTTSGVVLELFDAQAHRKRLEAAGDRRDGFRAAGGMAGRPYVPTGSWRPRDLGRDLDKALDFVAKKLEAKAAGRPELRYDAFMRSDEGPGTLFLLAVLAWQNGREAKANALAGRLFELAGDSRKVILGAMNVMADAQLAATATSFRITGDWKAYQAAVAALLEKYPVGWRKAGAARLLLDRLQKRASMTAPPPVTGEGLDDEDRALAVALAMENDSAAFYGHSSALWFLSPSGSARRGDETAGVVGRIQARGLQSIPLLLALARDETLCPRFRSDIGMPIRHTSWGRETEQREEERTRTYYREMDRPLTRGEIARHLLEPLCRRADSGQRRWHNEGERSPEEVVASARETYRAIRELPRVEQAAYFLKNGDSPQQQAAIGFLMEDDIEKHAPRIEDFLLTPPADRTEIVYGGYGGGPVMRYVQKRGEKAADFVERYAAMRRNIERPAGMASEKSVAEQMRKALDQELATLRALVRKPDLSEAIDALVTAGKGEDRELMAPFLMLGRLPAKTVAPALLKAAVESTNVTVRSRILRMMPMLRFAGMEEKMQQGMESEKDVEAAMMALSAQNQASIGTNAAAWKILLNDPRPAVASGFWFAGAQNLTLADLAATAMETLYGAASAMDLYGGRNGENLPTEVMMRVLRARAMARLERTPEAELPQWPSAEDVPEERRAAIVAAVTQAAPADLPKRLEEFSAAENLYLAQVVEEDAAVGKALAGPSRRIASVRVDAALPDAAAARLKELEGAAVTTNAIAAMRACCMQRLADGEAFSIRLTSAGVGRGLGLVAQSFDAAGQGGMGYSNFIGPINRKATKPRGLVWGMLRGGEDRFAQATWLVQLSPEVFPDGAAAEKAGGGDMDDEEEIEERMMRRFEKQQEAFAEAAQAFCGGEEPLSGNASISFVGMLPPKPDAKRAEDAEEEMEGIFP